VVLVVDGSVPKRAKNRRCSFRRVGLRKLQETTPSVTRSPFFQHSVPWRKKRETLSRVYYKEPLRVFVTTDKRKVTVGFRCIHAKLLHYFRITLCTGDICICHLQQLYVFCNIAYAYLLFAVISTDMSPGAVNTVSSV
jgi:hypothetical protein